MAFIFKMPKLSPTMDEGTIAKWHKKEGEFVEAGELLLEISTDKATVEHNTLDEGWLKKILVSEGKAVKINEPIALFASEESESVENLLEEISKKREPQQAPQEEEKEEEKTPERAQRGFFEPVFTPEPPLEEYHFPSREGAIKASPFAKKLAKEQNLDLSSVEGTGPGGRVTSEDLKYASSSSFFHFVSKEIPETKPGTFEEIPLSPMRKIIGKKLQESKTFIPHFYVKQTIDADPLVLFRQQLKNVEINVTFNDMIIRAAALSLRKHPEVNSGYDSENQALIYFKTIDISFAVSLPEGLITPIIRHTDFKNLREIGREAKQLSEKARLGKLKTQEFKGGSFCVSNLGMFGISEFTAIINPPQSAILAVGGIEEKAVVKGGKVICGKTLCLTLSADHRVIDGALAATFIKTLQFLLENPISLVVGS